MGKEMGPLPFLSLQTRRRGRRGALGAAVAAVVRSRSCSKWRGGGGVCEKVCVFLKHFPLDHLKVVDKFSI
jgi:hypothetical protein